MGVGVAGLQVVAAAWRLAEASALFARNLCDFLSAFFGQGAGKAWCRMPEAAVRCAGKADGTVVK